jgi:hypothetical protein
MGTSMFDLKRKADVVIGGTKCIGNALSLGASRCRCRCRRFIKTNGGGRTDGNEERGYGRIINLDPVQHS